jgi:hypothetical protein
MMFEGCKREPFYDLEMEAAHECIQDLTLLDKLILILEIAK